MTLKTITGAAFVALLATEALAISGGGFSLGIRQQAEDYNGYVRMAHRTVYAVCFRNDQSRRADAEVRIDGLVMGTWRLLPNTSACIDRPARDTGQFTFYRADSAEGHDAGAAQTPRADRGLVSVRFMPEVERYQPPVAPYAYEDAPMANAMPRSSKQSAPSANRQYGAGVTGLSGQSAQRFGTAGPIEHDWQDMVTLELRLIHDPALDRPQTGARPLPGRYDRPAPPPL